MIEFLADLTLGLFIAKKECIILLSFLYLVIYPILEAIIVNIFHTPRAFTQADQWIFSIMRIIEANPTLIIIADATFIWCALYICHVLYVDTSWFEVFFCELLLLFDYLLQFQSCLSDFNQASNI